MTVTVRPWVTPLVVSEFPAQRRLALLSCWTSTMQASARESSSARSTTDWGDD